MKFRIFSFTSGNFCLSACQRNIYSSNQSQRNNKGNRRITADTALRLSKFFGNSARFWLGLQNDYDLEEELTHKGNELNEIKPREGNAA